VKLKINVCVFSCEVRDKAEPRRAQKNLSVVTSAKDCLKTRYKE